MRFPVSRRSLLLSGSSAASLVLLSACGLRLDTDPDIPSLDAVQELRNRIARILAATAPGAGDPDSAGEDLPKFRNAIGPAWSPPSGFATEAPVSEPDRTFLDAAEVVARSVFDPKAQLGSGLIPVLADVATGLTLIAGEKKAELIAGADELIRAGREKADDSGVEDVDDGGAGQPGSDTGGSDGGDSDAQVKVWNVILNHSRAAAYGYERLAVNFEKKSPERKGALARLESLGSLSGEMLERLGEKDADPGASAWKLDPSPTDADTAGRLALNLEDGLLSALLGWLDTDASAILRLWESARARTVFARPQPLRFAYSGKSGDMEATT